MALRLLKDSAGSSTAVAAGVNRKACAGYHHPFRSSVEDYLHLPEGNKCTISASSPMSVCRQARAVIHQQSELGQARCGPRDLRSNCFNKRMMMLMIMFQFRRALLTSIFCSGVDRLELRPSLLSVCREGLKSHDDVTEGNPDEAR